MWSSQLGLCNTPTASLQEGKTLHNECPRYDTKQSDDEAAVILSTPSLPLLPGLLWPGMAAPDRVLSIGQIERFDI